MNILNTKEIQHVQGGSLRWCFFVSINLNVFLFNKAYEFGYAHGQEKVEDIIKNNENPNSEILKVVDDGAKDLFVNLYS